MLKERYTLKELENYMAENPTLKIKKKFLYGLGTWLQRLSLVGRESRERTKFVETLSEEIKENELMRVEILKKYADIDPETKELIMITNEDKSQHYSIPDEKMAAFTDEMTKYLEEDFVVSGEGNIQRLKVVKDIVLNTQEKIAPNMAEDYSQWCDAFEKVEV